ncbi:MAG: transcription antitermination factor NusB, partial [Gemmatimonadota bacterium]
MTDATPARIAALDVLRAVRRGVLADRALERVLERLPARQRPWTQELVYGTLRLRGRLDHLLDRQVRRGIESLEPDVLDVLRLGLYQLLEMHSVPAYAAVSQSVELARRVGGRGADRLVNGVLQALKRRMDAIGPPPFEDDPEAYLTSWGSHPAWLVRRWIERYGADGARALVEANNRRPELFIRPVGLEREAALARLEQAGIEAEPVDPAPDAIRVAPPAGAEEALDAVPAVVQDPAAGLVARYAEPPTDARVGDLCAAPGGKAVALAERASYVVAADVSPQRMRRLEENLA